MEYYSSCPPDNVTIVSCEDNTRLVPIILSYDDFDINKKELTVTIDTSIDKETKVCLKSSRNGKTDSMISEPFYLKICSSNCPLMPDGCQAL